MDQREVVGVGNIYAAEALFWARIRPARRAGKITRPEAERLATAVRKVLSEAISKGGTTIRDYRQAGGSSGEFQRRLKVYDRAGKKCSRCGSIIRWSVQAGRSSFWCPACQT